MKEIRCRDAGVDCDFVARAENFDELMKKVKEHAQKDHGYKDIPPELVEKALSRAHQQLRFVIAPALPVIQTAS